MDYILQTTNLEKVYGKQKAAENINLSIKKGDIYGLIGKNGAGKTTILRMLANLAEPSSGEILFYGKRRKEAMHLNTNIGALIEEPGIFPNLSAWDNLHLKAIAQGVTRKGHENELLHLVGLENVGKKKTKGFSLGMRQRLGLAITKELIEKMDGYIRVDVKDGMFTVTIDFLGSSLCVKNDDN